MENDHDAPQDPDRNRPTDQLALMIMRILRAYGLFMVVFFALLLVVPLCLVGCGFLFLMWSFTP